MPENKAKELIEAQDPYRWLEDSDSKDTQGWIKKQNKKTDSFLKDENFDLFSKELEENFKEKDTLNPTKAGEYYFYRERLPDEDQLNIYVKRGLEGKPQKIVKVSGTDTIDYWKASHTGKLLVYGISSKGDEMATLFIKDVEGGKVLEKIPYCRYSSICWLPDDSGFFYTRHLTPTEVPKGEENMHEKVYFHKLGEEYKKDPMIFGKDRPKDDMPDLELSPDGKYLAIHNYREWTKNDIYLYDVERKEVTDLIVGEEAKFSLQFLEDRAVLLTNHQAENQKILQILLEKLTNSTLSDWEPFVKETDSQLIYPYITKNKIILEYLENACSKTKVVSHEGKDLGGIDMPQYASLMGITSCIKEEEFFYAVGTFLEQRKVYRFDPETESYSIHLSLPNLLDPDEYEVKQNWCASKDGTKVPYFIVHRKNIELNMANATVLYGYGGFTTNQTPAFMKTWVPWFERGGVFAVANIRGGGEFGESWHKSGIKENKQNSFDDFVAVAKDLVKNKYTSSSHLGILGGSNGGLLVSVAGVQEPSLFKSVCSKVPLTDMVRFPLFGMASRWIHEYGDPTKKEDLERILRWSPYHNVKEGVTYPTFLFTTGEKDTRVHPLHARKMTAKLQEVEKEERTFLFTEKDAGHGMGKPVSKIVESQALTLNFFTKTLGLLHAYVSKKS